MKYLIVNADDFGMTRRVCDGIMEAYEYGIVRSTTMLANTEHFDYALSLLSHREIHRDKLGVGAHLTLTFGRPVSNNVPSLTNKRGEFFKEAEFGIAFEAMDDEEITREFAAQIQKLLDAGISLTHLDTHHHLHKSLRIHEIVASLADKYGIGMRNTGHPCHGVKTTEEFTDKFHGASATDLNLKMLLKKYQKVESLEIMCHPGKFDSELLCKSRYAKKREVELFVLTRYSLQTYLNSLGIDLVNFGQL